MHVLGDWRKLFQFTTPSKTEVAEPVLNIEKLRYGAGYDMQRLFIPTPSFRFAMGPVETFRVYYKNELPPLSYKKLGLIPHITMDMSRMTMKECRQITKYLYGEWVPSKGKVRDNWVDQKGLHWQTRVELLVECMEKWIEDRERDYLKAWMPVTKVSVLGVVL